MDKIHDIVDKLTMGTPIALARFNDGEMTGIAVPGTTIARGDQYVYKSLQQDLLKALQHKQKNYYRGIPCGTCWPIQRDIADRVINGYENEYLTSAVVLTNRNIKKFAAAFQHISQTRSIGWIGGANQDLNQLYIKGFIATRFYEFVDIQNSWSQYDEVRESIVNNIMDTEHAKRTVDIYAFSCGPVARVLVCSLFEEFPHLTFLDIGAVFDNFTKDYWLGCHDGTLAPCPECN